MATYAMQAASLSGVVVPSSLKMSSSSSITGQRLAMPSSISSSSSRITCMATQPTPAEVSMKEAPDAPEGWTPPQLNPDTPSPIFGGSTGGLLRKAQIEEFYAITWEAPKEQIFEMPTAGAAVMRAGPNLLKLSRKEQCLCLGRQLRAKFKINYQIYRIFPNGEVQYLHPKDGVYPEKVNAGRKGVNINLRPIGKNPNPAALKFSGGKTPYSVE